MESRRGSKQRNVSWTEVLWRGSGFLRIWTGRWLHWLQSAVDEMDAGGGDGKRSPERKQFYILPAKTWLQPAVFLATSGTVRVNGWESADWVKYAQMWWKYECKVDLWIQFSLTLFSCTVENPWTHRCGCFFFVCFLTLLPVFTCSSTQ